ncbi:MAG: hypothetical protein LBT87_05670, partial [Treponema sp.]|nr:hypothetical protein [Treponema sp.]
MYSTLPVRRPLFRRLVFLFCLFCLSSCTRSDPPAFLVDLAGGKASKPSGKLSGSAESPEKSSGNEENVIEAPDDEDAPELAGAIARLSGIDGAGTWADVLPGESGGAPASVPAD